MAQAKAATKDAKKKPQAGTIQTFDARLQTVTQSEHVPDTPASLQRYLGNSYAQAMTASDGSATTTPAWMPLRPSRSGILQRKCACGNPATGGRCNECSRKQRAGLQTKLEVNEPGDIYEREADRVVAQVLATPAHHDFSGAPPRIQRFSGQLNPPPDQVPASVDQALASPGRPLEPSLRQEMEQRFRYDFSDVRVHTDARAVESAQAVSARAYTVGRDIVFAEGQYAPDSKQGRKLLAHELTHTIQQSAISPHDPLTMDPAGIACERTAEGTGRSTTNSVALPQASRLALQRAPAPGVTGKPAKHAFALDKRKRTWRRYAQSEAQKDAARMLKSGKLSPEDRQEVNAKLAFFEGKAKEIYIREIRPALLRVTPREPIEVPESPESYVGKLPGAEGAKVMRRRRHTIRFFSKIKDYQLEQAYISRLQRYLDEGLEANEYWDLETIEEIVRERAPNAPWHEKARQNFLAQLQVKLQERERRQLLPQLPAYWQNQMGALSEQTQKWPQEAQSLARDLLWKWYELRKKASPDPSLAIPGIEGSIEATIRQDLLSHYERVLRAADQRIQEECRKNPPGRLMKIHGDPCEPWKFESFGRGSHALHNFETLLKIFRDKDGVPYRTVFFWIEKYLKERVPVSMAGRHLELLQARALLASAFSLAPVRSVRIPAVPSVATVRPPTVPPVAVTKPIQPRVPPTVAPPAPVSPIPTGSRTPTFPRRVDVTHGGPFTAPPAKPTAPMPAAPVTPPIATGRSVKPAPSGKPTPPAAPASPTPAPPAAAVVAPPPAKPAAPVAPVQPVRPKGFRAWRLGARLKLLIEGVEVSGAAPGIGAGGATASNRPTPAVVVKTTPQPAAPTPAPLPPAPTPPRAVSPAKTVTPSAPSRPVTAGEAIGTPAPTAVPAGTTPQAPQAGTAGAVASIRVTGGATSQSTVVPGGAATTATAGTIAQGTGFTHDQVLDLFVRYFKRPGPPQGTIVFHPTQASYEAAEQAAGFWPGATLGFFDTGRELVHLPPTVTDLTAMHEALHMIGRQSGVEGVLGRYVEEGLTEWLARSLGPVAERRAYDGNVAFVRLLANIVGEDTLRNAYLHRLWAPLRSALRTRLGSEAAVQHLYHQLKQVGPQGENGRVLQGVFDMLWPGSSTAEPLTTTTPAPAATTGSAVSARMPATQRPGGPGGGGPPTSGEGRDLRFEDAVNWGRDLVKESVWLQEIRRISGLEHTRRAGELRDFIAVYSRHSGTAIDLIPADQASSYGIGARNWGTYLPDQNRIVMHEGIFTTAGVNPVREIGHEVGAAELRRVYGISKDNIPTVDVGPDVRSRMGGDSLTHVIDTLIKAPD